VLGSGVCPPDGSKFHARSDAVELDPSHVNAQVALGIAALRDRDTAAALAPLEKAVVLEPRNPFARRTLGQLLLMEDETAAALPHLRAAAEVAADDPINLFTYAQALLASDGDSHVAEADALFKQALRLAPVGELAERIKNQQRKLADRVMRANAQGMPRMDAVEYLISALAAYRELEPEGRKQLLAEVVALSQRGLATNDPSQKHTLRHYRDGSTVSALEAACVYYTGVQLLLPGHDPGLDLGREYALAQGMLGEGE
jgi:tetratricopeptide (TPR) repeat protein